MHSIPRLMFLFPWFVASLLTTAQADDPEFFPDRIAPIFERHCLSCHNNEERKGGYSLALREEAFADGFILGGEPDASYLLELITPIEGKAAMPKGADPLPQESIDLIREWIKAGAGWPDEERLSEPVVDDFDWWSYRPLERPAIPKVIPAIEGLPAENPIDAFVLEKLAAKGLTPVPLADRRTLIRRLTFDLTGLPPSPAEVTNFVNDNSDNAYEQLVDRLLSSPRYGERWARHWLDVVKYADTCGYDKDKLRPNAWPYRDYVIRTFNDDKPFGRFIEEQIAGDILFPGEPDGILGLGFIAAGPWDFIGHVEVPETKIDGMIARNLDRDDMVANVMNTFCAVTVQCARCHNHKFDPVTREHYYGMQAVFAAVDRAERPYDLDPGVESRRRSLNEDLTIAREALNQLEQSIVAEGGDELQALKGLIQELETRATVNKAPEYGYHSAIAATADVHKWVEVDLGRVQRVREVSLQPCHDEYAGIGAGFGFPRRFRVEVASESGAWHLVADVTKEALPNPGLASFTVKELDTAARWIRVTAVELAERSNDFIFALAELRVMGEDGVNLAADARVEALDSIEAPIRWGKANLVDGKWATDADSQAATALSEAREELATILARLETAERVARRAALAKRISEAEQELASLPQGRMVYAAATQFTPQGNFKPTSGKPRLVHVLHRGEVTKPLELAIPGVLPLTADADWKIDAIQEGERRAAVARWLSDEANPLVWRVIVNRVWQYHFGVGIVATPNDFGRMGAEPTHPELLDWLATEFLRQGQSFKALHRLIVTSETYRRSAVHNDTNAGIDGGNQYLWRMNRRRLEAEEIRDAILSVSGNLDLTMGGPGFYLFELEKAEHSPHYEYHKFDPSDPASHRRAIYRFVVRSQPDPWMATLDCADSSQSTPRRDETLTALQALSLLNNRFNTEMAERFATHVRSQAGLLDEQVKAAFESAIQRQPNDDELASMVAYARTHGLENYCRLLFNLSEFVFLD